MPGRVGGGVEMVVEGEEHALFLSLVFLLSFFLLILLLPFLVTPCTAVESREEEEERVVGGCEVEGRGLDGLCA